jgi:hypothetical protein
MKTRAVDRPVAYWSGELLDQTRLEYEAAKTHGAWRAVALVAVALIVGALGVTAGPAVSSGVSAAAPAVWTFIVVGAGLAIVGLGIYIHARKS